MPVLGQAQHLVELPLGERHALGGALDLDEPARRGHDHVHVHLGPAVLLVGEVQHAHPIDHADRHGRDASVRGCDPEGALLDEPGEGVVQGHVRPADRRRAGTAVGLQHVTVHGDLDLSQGHHVADRAQGPPDQALDLLGATRLLALGRLATDPLAGGPGQQGVLGGDPSLAAPPHPWGDPLLDRRRAQRPGTTHGHQDGAGGEDGEVAFEGRRAQFVVGPTVPSPDDPAVRSCTHTLNTFPISACSTDRPNAAAASTATAAAPTVGHR